MTVSGSLIGPPQLLPCRAARPETVEATALMLLETLTVEVERAQVSSVRGEEMGRALEAGGNGSPSWALTSRSRAHRDAGHYRRQEHRFRATGLGSNANSSPRQVT